VTAGTWCGRLRRRRARDCGQRPRQARTRALSGGSRWPCHSPAKERECRRKRWWGGVSKRGARNKPGTDSQLLDACGGAVDNCW